jgi:hypothetical protein
MIARKYGKRMLRRSILAVQNVYQSTDHLVSSHVADNTYTGTKSISLYSNFQLSYRSRIQVCVPDVQKWRRRRMSVIRGFGLRQSSNPWSIGRSGSGWLDGCKVVELVAAVKCVWSWKWVCVSKRR